MRNPTVAIPANLRMRMAPRSCSVSVAHQSIHYLRSRQYWDQALKRRARHSLLKRAFQTMSGLPPVATELRTLLVVGFVPLSDSCIAAITSLFDHLVRSEED